MIDLKWLWLIWGIGTGICVWIYFAQEAALKNWQPSNVKAPLEDLDVFILFWIFVGTGLLIYNLVGSLIFIFNIITRRKK